MEESVADKIDTYKAKFLALNLKKAHSLTSIRDRLNEGSADIASNRPVQQLIIEVYGDVALTGLLLVQSDNSFSSCASSFATCWTSKTF